MNQKTIYTYFFLDYMILLYILSNLLQSTVTLNAILYVLGIILTLYDSLILYLIIRKKIDNTIILKVYLVLQFATVLGICILLQTISPWYSPINIIFLIHFSLSVSKCYTYKVNILNYELSTSTRDTCSICLQEVQPGQFYSKLPCNHEFHYDCIQSWLNEARMTCPLCRNSTNNEIALNNLA